MASIKETLENSDTFKGLPNEWLTKIAELARLEEYPEKSYLFLEGDEPGDMFVIESGKVAMDISASPTPGVGHQITVDTLGKGQTCGWSSVMGSYVYTMTARCTEPVRVIAFNGESLRSFLDDNPDIGYRVMENMAWIVQSRFRNMRISLPIALGRAYRSER